MASIYPTPLTDGTVHYKAQIRIKGLPLRSKTFATRDEANAWADEQMREIRHARRHAGVSVRGDYSSGEMGDEKLSHTLELFWKKKATKANQAILPALMRNVGAVTLGRLTERWIEDFIALMRRTKTVRDEVYSYGTILKQLRLIKAAIVWRARRLEVKSVPAFPFSTKTLFPRDWEVKRERRLGVAEEQRLRQVFRLLGKKESIYWRLLMRFAIETCARQGEIIKANWSEISTVNGFSYWTIPKEHNKSGCTRVVPLTVNAMRLVRMLRRMCSPVDSRIFHFFKTPDVVSHLFHRYVVESGIEDFRFHDLRHEGITRFVLRERNFTVDEVMRLVGHKSREMLDRYTNARGDELTA